MDGWLIGRMLVLLALANATPLLVNAVVGKRWAYPLDGGVRLGDGQPLFGASKTIRGIVSAVVATALGGVVVGWGWKVGAVVGLVAMGGDLFSSFVKRRLRLAAGSRATGLDQIPESLFPLLACWTLVPMRVVEMVVVVALFFVSEVVLSVVFFRLHLRERPY